MRNRRLLLVIASVLFGVSVVEVGLRIADARAERARWSFRMHEEERGWALRPGFAGWVTAENNVWVEINSDGLRDREHSLEKPAGTVRVAVLGDSYMHAVNVPLEKTFTSFLEARLGGCTRQAEVLNFGVAGYSTAQELLTYRHHAARYRPEIVVLAVFTGNDIFDNHRDLNESSDDEVPYFVFRGNAIVLDQKTPEGLPEARLPWPQRVRERVTGNVMTARLLWDGYALLRSPFVAPQLAEVVEPESETNVMQRARWLYQPLSTPEVEQAWQVTEALIQTLAREVAAQGAEFWLVTLSNAEQVDPNVSARRAFANLLGVDDLFHPDRRLRDFARGQGIPVVSLAEPLAEYAATNGGYLNGGYNQTNPRGTGHWNETANRLAAGLVGERLCAESRAVAAR